MNIWELEKAVKTLIDGNSPQLALAALAGHPQVRARLSGELVHAARTLAGRHQPVGGEAILRFSPKLGWW